MARSYVARGWQVVAIAHREKGPQEKHWTTHPPTLEELPRWFAVTHPRQRQPNIGLLTGRISGGLVDVDCDTREAALAAEELLPPTKRISGRAGHPRSHYWYVCADAEKLPQVKFGVPRASAGRTRARNAADHESMLVELRGEGCQTVAPPSIHPSGERIRWEKDSEGEPTVVRYDELKAAVAQVAACALLARSWPAEGTRDEAAMALSGMLVRAEWSVERTDAFVQLVAWIAGDEEWSKRGKAADDLRRLNEGKTVRGKTALAKLLAGDGVAIVKQVRAWLKLDKPPSGGGQGVGLGSASARPAEATAAYGVRLVRSRAEALAEKELRWLWPGRIPLGAITLLDGDPGLGKSLVTIDLAARLTKGLPMPEEPKEAERLEGGALLLSAEDDPSATVKPRLRVAGAEMDRVTIIHAVEGWDAERGVVMERGFQLPGDISLLEEAVREVDARLLIIDPLMAYLDGKLNSWRDQDVRGALAPLARLAEQLDLAVLILRHLTKGGGTNALYRGGGSIGVIGAARSGLLVAKDRDDPEHARVLAPTKSNLGPPVPALKYHIEVVNGVGRVVWDGPVTTTANELLAENDHPTKSRTATLDDWLRAQLAEGPVAVKEIERRAGARGWTMNQARDAKDRVGASRWREGYGGEGGWMWSMTPPAERPPKVTSRAKDGLSRNGSSLREEVTFAQTPSSKMTAIIKDDLITERTSLDDELIFDPEPHLLDTSDAPTLTVTATNGTPLTLTRHTVCPSPPSGGAHEYAMLRDAKGRRACIHCHTIEGTEGERLEARAAKKEGGR